MKLKILAISLLLLTFFAVQAQDKDKESSPEELYLDANSYFFFEDYEEALALYQQLIREIPKNSNLNYRIGICYLNLPGKRHKSIPFLESASSNVSKSYKENSIKEQKAPIDTYFFLGSAYLANNQLAKAKEAFSKFQSITDKKSKRYDVEMLELQMKTIESSAAIQNQPVNFILSNLGSVINDRFSNFSPALSYNGQVLAYTSKRKFYQAIYVSRKDGNGWSNPVNITPELETDQNLQTLSLNYNGTELYLYKDDNRDGNIYVSHYRNGRWNPIENLGANINTKYWESSACISPDGKTLYFSSNREGGFGELDLYKSTKQPNGSWGPAQNLGPTINTSHNEIIPSLTATGSTLFFASDGQLGLGGYDIYFSNAKGNQWSSPENLGYPLNTPDDDFDFRPIDDGQYGLMARFDNDSYGEMDIFKVEVFSDRYAREVVLHNQLESRKRNAGEKLLVIDTLSAQKMALVLPEGSNFDEYTGADKRVKLYFNGNRYDLRDKISILASKKGTINESVSRIDPNILQNIDSRLLRSNLDNNSSSKSDASLSKAQGSNEVPFMLDSRYQTNLGQQINNLIADIFNVPGMPQRVSPEQGTLLSNDNSIATQFYKIFKAIGLNVPDSAINSSAFSQQAAPVYLMSNFLKLEKTGPNSSDELLAALVEFLDKLVPASDNSYTSRSKSGVIIKDRSTDNFLRLFNLVKSKASGKLKLMLDSIDPESNKIRTFEQLITMLKSIDEVEFQNYKDQLISIMAEVAAEEFCALNASARNDLLAKFESANSNIYIKYGGGVTVIVVLFLIILFLIRKRKKKNKN